MTRQERVLLTARAVWLSIFVASVIGALVTALWSLWLFFGCFVVALGCFALAVLVKVLMGDDRADD
jgi:hypothetical protein